ncbi:MAG: putative addiction module antidote protein [Zoogloeaceae bacterium]|jgi:probable addiction module antidote protein|nr:putative addiction module antidote protein [Zoogloeaceae bacterium]
MVTTTKPLDIAEYLETDEDIAGFLNDMLTDGSPAEFRAALSIAARARGMADIAKKANVTRASLYKSLSETGEPRFDTIRKVIDALGMKLVVTA